MAISLGAAALAFAGGAATQYNKMADEERKAEAKRKERLQELVDQAMVKQEETKYTYEMSEHQKDLALAETLKSVRGGARSGQGQLAIAERHGLDRAMFLRSEDFGYMTFDGPGKSPIPYTQRMMEYASSDYDPKKIKFAERYRQKHEGKTYTKDGAGILRGVDTDPTGRAAPIDVARGLGLSENDPAWLVGDPSNLDEEAYRKYMQDTARQLRGEKPDSQWLVDKDTGAITLAQVDSTGKGTLTEMQPGREGGFAGASPEGKQIADLMKLQGLVEKNPELQPMLDTYQELIEKKPNLEFLHGTRTDDGVSRDYAMLVEKTPEGTNIIDTTEIGAKAAGSTVDGRAQRDIMGLYERTASAREIQEAVVFRMRNFTRAQADIPGAITSTVDYFQNNLTGLMQLAGVNQETMDERLNTLRGDKDYEKSIEELRQSNSYLNNWSKSNLEWLSYTMANVLKDVGDERSVTKYDIEAGAKLVSRLFSSEGGLAASTELLYRMDVRTAQSHQLIYQDERATPEQKRRSGRLLARTVAPDLPLDQIISSPQTGQVYVFGSKKHLNQFKTRVQEMGLMNKNTDAVLEAFPEELRPKTLETFIEDANGWLMPEMNPERYESMISGKQR